MLRLLLLAALIGAGALVLLARDDAGGPLADDDRAAPRRERRDAREQQRRPFRHARCPADGARCRSVTGRIVFLESIDPDGDGDLHVVIAAGGISLPGLTAVDVRPGLRPRRDPRIGDLATAAGPVQTGSYGQKQIHALRFAVER